MTGSSLPPELQTLLMHCLRLLRKALGVLTATATWPVLLHESELKNFQYVPTLPHKTDDNKWHENPNKKELMLLALLRQKGKAWLTGKRKRDKIPEHIHRTKFCMLTS